MNNLAQKLLFYLNIIFLISNLFFLYQYNYISNHKSSREVLLYSAHQNEEILSFCYLFLFLFLAKQAYDFKKKRATHYEIFLNLLLVTNLVLFIPNIWMKRQFLQISSLHCFFSTVYHWVSMAVLTEALSEPSQSIAYTYYYISFIFTIPIMFPIQWLLYDFNFELLPLVLIPLNSIAFSAIALWLLKFIR